MGNGYFHIKAPNFVQKLRVQADLRFSHNVADMLYYRRAFSNYFAVLYHILRRSYPFWATIRHTNKRLLIPNPWVAFLVSRGGDIEYIPEKKLLAVTINERTYYFLGALSNGDLLATVVNREYAFLNVEGELVLDIGANIGDTAIYFVAKGAKHVFGVEPYPNSFGYAKQNVEINGFADRITLLNAGISDADHEVTIDPDFLACSSNSLRRFDSGVTVPLLTLQRLVEKFQIEDAVLKIDCEGHEYEAVLPASIDVLRRFKQIQLEYHYGPYELVRKLEKSGFRVSFDREKYVFNKHASIQHMWTGHIRATRV